MPQVCKKSSPNLESHPRDLSENQNVLKNSNNNVISVVCFVLCRELSEAVSPLLLLSSSPVYGIRLMASRALVALMPCSKYTLFLSKLVEELPRSSEEPYFHNHLHGQFLQIKAMLTQVLHTDK